MMMNAKDYVQSLFRDYEETPELADFMEELQSNLEARIASLKQKGLCETDAFSRAASELGDVSEVAREMSLKRRQEVFEDAYMGIRHYMNGRRAAGYVLCGASFLFGIITALVTYFTAGLSGAFGTVLTFTVIAAAGFTFLGATQETAARYPLGKKRAAWYTLAVAAITFGVTLFPLVYVSGGGIMPALASEIPFLIPGLSLLAFLLLTERNRLKPWAAGHYRKSRRTETQLRHASAASEAQQALP